MTKEQIENILRIYPSIEEYEKITQLREAKEYLKNTDYVANKIVEYQILKKDIQDYTEILNKREEAREVIRSLED